MPETAEKCKPQFIPFTEAELSSARLAPQCIVENYLYADLALLCAPGGAGKTTLEIYESVCIALRFPVWGQQVITPGKTFFITAEDSRELYGARLREIMNAMRLTDGERAKVLASVAPWDVSAKVTRLAELDQSGNIQLTSLADDIVEAFKDDPPVIISFDPIVSFGPGERMVNDGEQALVTAARRIIRGLNCCVRFTHHTGKANARNGAIDQYAGRNGSALPDGSRMVAVLAALGSDSSHAMPEGFNLLDGQSGFILARSKLSYCRPQPNLFIRRDGFHFEHMVEQRLSEEDRIEQTERELAADADRLHAYLVSEIEGGTRHTRRTLRDVRPCGLSQSNVKSALARLEISGRVVDADLPKEEQQGGKKTYLEPRANWFESGKPVPPSETPKTTPEPSDSTGLDCTGLPKGKEGVNQLSSPPLSFFPGTGLNQSKPVPNQLNQYKVNGTDNLTLIDDPRVKELVDQGWSPWNARAKAQDEKGSVGRKVVEGVAHG